MNKIEKKRILIYGDSNTWGYISGTLNLDTMYCERYPSDVRWTGIVQEEFSDTHLIVEEGLPGRTTAIDDPQLAGLNGLKLLVPLLYSHRPIDTIIFMLGTNDLKSSFGMSPIEITRNISELCSTVKINHCGHEGDIPNIMIISPTQIANISESYITEEFSNANEKINELTQHLETLAKEKNYLFINASQIPLSKESDGIHLDKNAHKELALLVMESIKSAT